MDASSATPPRPPRTRPPSSGFAARTTRPSSPSPRTRPGRRCSPRRTTERSRRGTSRTLALEWRAAGLGGFAYALDLDPSSGRVAIGCGDGSVRSLAEGGSEPERADGGVLSPDGGLLSPDGGLLSRDGGFLWRGLANAKVTCVAWAPADGTSARRRRPGRSSRGSRTAASSSPTRGGGGAAPRHAAQKDGHAGGVLALRWSEAEGGTGSGGGRVWIRRGGSYDLVSLGGTGGCGGGRRWPPPRGRGGAEGYLRGAQPQERRRGGPRRDPPERPRRSST